MKVRLVFGTTNSQPIGMDDHDLEEVYQHAYKPFLRAAYNHPEVPVTLHYCGNLLQWLDKHHSEFTDVLSEMGQRRQVELLGGAFYDPVWALIPRPDRLGQIERMTTHLRKRFGRRPRGAWITEQVWEPSLPSLLKASGIDYTFLSDDQFMAGGLPSSALRAPCLTEDEGKTVIVFPLMRSLCNQVGSSPPEELIERLRACRSTDRDQLLSLIFNGESFAEQFESGERALEWIRRFLDLLVVNSDWIEVVTPWRHLRRVSPRRRGYFPPTSYRDLMNWCGGESVTDSGAVDNGHRSAGFFRRFLTHYPESNLMYAKMQYTHILVNQLRGDKYRKQLAREELWKGQCHNAYWHGKPGGIYQNQLRKRVYSCLIEAERVTREKGIFIPSVLSIDFDMDGLPEYLYQGHDINAYVHTVGGILFELDYLPVPWNYLDTFGRYRELYHDEGQEDSQAFDSYFRRAFVDHLWVTEPDAVPPTVPPATPAAQAASAAGRDADRATPDTAALSTGRTTEIGALFQTMLRVTDLDRDHNVLEMKAEVDEDGRRFTLHKRYRFRSSEVQVDYAVTNTAPTVLEGFFATEVNLGFLSDDDDALGLQIVGPGHVGAADGATVAAGAAAHEPTTHPHLSSVHGVHDFEARTVEFHDRINDTNVTLDLTLPAAVRIDSLQTAGRCVPEQKSQYQGTAVVPRWPIRIASGASWTVSATLRVAAR